MGAKKQPTYRIVVTEITSPRDGRFIENLGHFNPRTEPETLVVKQERAAYWLSVGAQPSNAVARLLRRVGLLVENGKPIPYVAEVADATSEEVVAEVADAASEEDAAEETPEAAVA
jgi:small subunit ribosomal protein S16